MPITASAQHARAEGSRGEGPSPATRALLGALHEAADIGDIGELESLLETAAAHKLLSDETQQALEALCDALNLEGVLRLSGELEKKAG